MAYDVEDILLIEAWDTTTYTGDDISWDATNTLCMTNGTLNEDCDEIKTGTICLRIEIAIPPATISALKVRIYMNSIMASGPNAILPYIDANSVDNTNEVILDYNSAGQWYEHVADAAFIAQLADLGDKIAIRFGANTAVAKSKIGEVEVDVTWDQPQLSGITKDKDGSVLTSCHVSLFKVIDEGPPHEYQWKESQISDGSTGAYSFGVYDGTNYMVYASKDDSPHVFDCTDNVLQADT